MMKKHKVHPREFSEQIFHTPEADPNGSYTGVPDDPEETPVQDADDL